MRVFAEDVLFVAKRTVLEMGYDQSYPNIGNGIDRMDWLMREQCFAKYGDPWRVVEHLHPLHHADDPRSARVAFAFSMYVWEDFDKYAEDYGTDYTVIGRDIYYFDNHLAWAIIPPLDENYLSQMPRIVEYGYQLATRCTVTNGKGFAGSAVAPAPYTDVDQYGIVDLLISNVSENAADEAPPTAGDLEQWAATAAQNLEDRYPTPVSIVVPANTTLLPGAPWDLDIMIPGAWFIADVTRTCRTVTEWQRLHEVVVTEAAPMGEMVQFTAVSAPSHMVLS